MAGWMRLTCAGNDDEPNPLLRRHVGQGRLHVCRKAVARCRGEVDDAVHVGRRSKLLAGGGIANSALFTQDVVNKYQFDRVSTSSG